MISTLLAAAALFAPQADTVPQAGTAQNEVKWFEGPFSAALEKARTESQPIFAYFWMDSSEYCVRVYGETITTDAAAAELSDYICFSANATQEEGSQLIKRYNVTTLPTMLFLSPDGRVDDAILGFIPLSDFLSEMQRIQQGSETVSAMRALADASPEDLDLRLTLAQKLAFVGDKQGSEELLESIRRVDPRGRTLAGAHLGLFDLRQNVIQSAT